MTNLIEQVKPEVLHMIDSYITKDGQHGELCIALTHETKTTDEASANITFTCDIYFDVEQNHFSYKRDLCYVISEVDIDFVVEYVDGCVWQPSDSDKEKIEQMIYDLVNANEPSIVAEKERLERLYGWD